MKLIIFLISVLAFAEDLSPMTFKKTKMILNDVSINVEVANDDDHRERGLMKRKKLSDDEGMIFIFDKAESQSFWMKNTIIPLSIGYFDAKGNLFQILDMVPASPMDLSPKVYLSSKPAKFALEEPIGWFKRKKISESHAHLQLPDLKLP